jgi:hypothetical protein
MGLSITFSALAIFIGVILLLQRFFPPGQDFDTTEERVAEQLGVSPLERDTTEEEIAVAITMALAQLYSYELCRSNLGVILEQGRSPWWTMGRIEQYPLDVVPIQGRN